MDSFNYDLPGERIAQFPLTRRDQSRLLVAKDGRVSEDFFFNLPDHLPENSLVIFNETRVIHARLLFRRETGSRIEIFCLEPEKPSPDYQVAFGHTGPVQWRCLVGNSKRWPSGRLVLECADSQGPVRLQAERVSRHDDGTSSVQFSWSAPHLSFASILEQAGKIPLPPYIQREAADSDNETYQTVFARNDGSVAAPTAGLHFTGEVLERMESKGAKLLKFTLHVGAGTFRPVNAPNLEGHEMHAENIYFTVDQLRDLKRNLHRPVVLVGTTTTRLMESLYWHGVKIIKGTVSGPAVDIGQWDPYTIGGHETISRDESLDAVISACHANKTSVLSGVTRLMIAPGYQFRYPDVLITNFHQPKSTLLLLIAAFIGDEWRAAYAYALKNRFRFLSYGDSCLFFKVPPK